MGIFKLPVLAVLVCFSMSEVAASNHDIPESSDILHVTVTPSSIDVGFNATQSLQVHCQYTGGSTTKYMALGRRCGDQDGVLLAQRHRSDPAGQIDTTPDFPAMTSVNGNLNKVGTQFPFMSITIQNPGVDDACVYVCQNIHRENKKDNTLWSYKGVSLQEPKLEDIVQHIKNLQQTVAELECDAAKNSFIRELVWEHMFTTSATFNDSSVYIYPEYISPTYSKAEDICNYIGGYLAEVDTEEEWDFIEAFLKPIISNKERVLLGATDIESEGNFTNRHSGTPAGFTKWQYYEPNNEDYHGSPQHCQAMGHDYYDDFVDLWMYDEGCQYSVHDYDEDINISFLCEVPADIANTSPAVCSALT